MMNFPDFDIQIRFTEASRATVCFDGLSKNGNARIIVSPF